MVQNFGVFWCVFVDQQDKTSLQPRSGKTTDPHFSGSGFLLCVNDTLEIGLPVEARKSHCRVGSDVNQLIGNQPSLTWTTTLPSKEILGHQVIKVVSGTNLKQDHH